MKGTAERDARYTQLFHAHVAQVRGFARTLVAEPDVEDIVSATFRTAWIRLDDVPSASVSAKAWLFGVARNHMLNHVRAERRREAVVDALSAVHGGATSDHDVAAVAELTAALGQLTTAEREVVQLAAWHEMQPVEIARVLGIGRSAARVRLYRARHRLEQLIAEPSMKGGRDV